MKLQRKVEELDCATLRKILYPLLPPPVGHGKGGRRTMGQAAGELASRWAEVQPQTQAESRELGEQVSRRKMHLGTDQCLDSRSWSCLARCRRALRWMESPVLGGISGTKRT